MFQHIYYDNQLAFLWMFMLYIKVLLPEFQHYLGDLGICIWFGDLNKKQWKQITKSGLVIFQNW